MQEMQKLLDDHDVSLTCSSVEGCAFVRWELRSNREGEEIAALFAVTDWTPFPSVVEGNWKSALETIEKERHATKDLS